MKKKLQLTIIFLFFSTVTLFAQPNPPSNPSNGANGPVGGTSGGNTPVGSGLVIMLVMGAAYAGIKGVKSLDNKATESEEVRNQ